MTNTKTMRASEILILFLTVIMIVTVRFLKSELLDVTNELARMRMAVYARESFLASLHGKTIKGELRRGEPRENGENGNAVLFLLRPGDCAPCMDEIMSLNRIPPSSEKQLDSGLDA